MPLVYRALVISFLRIFDVILQLAMENAEHVLSLIQRADLEAGVRSEELRQHKTNHQHGVHPEDDLAPGGGGEDAEDGDDSEDDAQADQSEGEVIEKRVNKMEAGHVVASVEKQSQEEHAKPGSQEANICYH